MDKTPEEKLAEAKEKLRLLLPKLKETAWRYFYGILSIVISYVFLIIILNCSFEQATFLELCWFVGRWEYITLVKKENSDD